MSFLPEYPNQPLSLPQRPRCLRRPRSQHNVRAAEDPQFRSFLLDVGNGRAPYDLDLAPNAVVLPASITASSSWTPVDLARFVYGDLVSRTMAVLTNHRCEDLAHLAAEAILTPKNEDVQAINDQILAFFPAESVSELPSATTIIGRTPEDYQAFPAEYLHSLNLPQMPPPTLCLCPGAMVSLLRNVDYERGLCNGTRCLVVHISPRILDVLILTGRSRGARAVLPRIPLTPSDWALPVRVARRQFPLRLGWAMTMNKAQGQTLQRCFSELSAVVPVVSDFICRSANGPLLTKTKHLPFIFAGCGLHLPRPVFAHGQLYVALSRVRRAADLRILLGTSDESRQGYVHRSSGVVTAWTQNVVYPEILRS